MARDALPDALLDGDSAAWGSFVRRYGGLIVAAVRGIAPLPGDIEDLTQDVFVRLCKDDFRLLRSYDPGRAALSNEPFRFPPPGNRKRSCRRASARS